MSLIDALRYRVRTLLNPREHEQEAAEELEFHLGLEVLQREHAAGGALPAAEARHAARRRFGNVAYYQEEIRQVAGLARLDAVSQDARFALRSFARTPVFTAIAVLTLAIGIGGSTAIFSALHALLLRPLPFHEPDRLVSLALTFAERGSNARSETGWSHPKFEAFRERQTVFSHLTHWAGMQYTIRVAGEAVRANGEFVDADYLPTLGVQPVLGRAFNVSDDDHDGPRVVVLEYELWQKSFIGSPDVLGASFDVDGVPHTIIGVAPQGFRGLSGLARFWVPIVSRPAELVTDPYAHAYFSVARLKDEVPVRQAQAASAAVGRQVDALYPSHIPGDHWSADARPLDETRVDARLRRTLLILFSAAGLVLLIACANVANLFLVRASSRRREIAVRLALGAGRARLVRQLLVESVLLSLLGGVAGVFVAWWGVRMLTAVDAAAVFRWRNIGGLGTVSFTDIRLDAATLAFAAALAVGTGLLFGLVPALQSTRFTLTDALKERKSGGGFRLRGFASRNVLAAFEIALAVVLLAASGLMVLSLTRLLGVRPGFAAENVLTLRVNRAPQWSRDSIVTFYDRALERLRTLPGVTDVALADCPPLNAGCFDVYGVALLDRPPAAPGMQPSAGVHWITPNWPALMHVPLLRGRTFTNTDNKHSRRVVLVNETAARWYWPMQDPIDKPIALSNSPHDTAWVVGVVGDLHYGGIEMEMVPDIYVSYYQVPLSYRMMFFLRTRGDPMAAVPSARAALRDVAPGFPIHEVAPLETLVAAASAYARLSTLMLGLFAAVALILATLGVYGVISYATSQRTSEISVRIALGATRAVVVRSVVWEGVALLAVGGTAGLAAALAGTRLLRSVLYEVAPTDPPTLLGMVGVIAVAVLLASWIPARRAARAPVIPALRSD